MSHYREGVVIQNAVELLKTVTAKLYFQHLKLSSSDRLFLNSTFSQTHKVGNNVIPIYLQFSPLFGS